MRLKSQLHPRSNAPWMFRLRFAIFRKQSFAPPNDVSLSEDCKSSDRVRLFMVSTEFVLAGTDRCNGLDVVFAMNLE